MHNAHNDLVTSGDPKSPLEETPEDYLLHRCQQRIEAVSFLSEYYKNNPDKPLTGLDMLRYLDEYYTAPNEKE